MPGHVLYFPQITGFQPVNNHALADLCGIRDIGVDLLYIPEQMKQAVFNVFAAVKADKQLLFNPDFVDPARFSGRFGFGYFLLLQNPFGFINLESNLAI